MKIIALAAAMAVLCSSTAFAEPSATQPAASDSDKLICKRFEETGSLVKKKRVCHTKAEWARINELDQDAARRFVDENRGRPPGN